MTGFSHVEVKLDRNGKGQVWIDGQALASAYAISIEGRAGEAPKVRLTLNAPEVTFSGEAQVSGLPGVFNLSTMGRDRLTVDANGVVIRPPVTIE
jgi:hypothetical protein